MTGRVCADCGKLLTAEEQEYYGHSCEPCERNAMTILRDEGVVLQFPSDYRRGKDVHTVINEWQALQKDEPDDSHVAVQLEIWEMRQVLAYLRQLEQRLATRGPG